MDPVNPQFARLRDFSFVQLPIDAGISLLDSEDREFIQSESDSNVTRFPISESVFSSLRLIDKVLRLFRSNIGDISVKLFPANHNVSNLLSFPNSMGIVPDKLLYGNDINQTEPSP